MEHHLYDFPIPSQLGDFYDDDDDAEEKEYGDVRIMMLLKIILFVCFVTLLMVMLPKMKPTFQHRAKIV